MPVANRRLPWQAARQLSMHANDASEAERIRQLHRQLGISETYVAERGLRFFKEAQELVMVGTRSSGQEFRLLPEAARAWTDLLAAAQREGIALQLVSAFRSIDRQGELIERKLNRGAALSEVLTILAVPGCSEHHTGCALDLTTPGCPPAHPQFENTPAFRWLAGNAGGFGFVMSYPRDNAEAYQYEPWHWCYRRDGLSWDSGSSRQIPSAAG